MKRKRERYRLVWKERIGFTRLANQYGVPIVRFASVGVDDRFEIVMDAAEILRSPIGELLRALGITEQPRFRHGETVPPLARGKRSVGLPRFERQYLLFGAAIGTKRFAGRHDDAKSCLRATQGGRAGDRDADRRGSAGISAPAKLPL